MRNARYSSRQARDQPCDLLLFVARVVVMVALEVTKDRNLRIPAIIEFEEGYCDRCSNDWVSVAEHFCQADFYYGLSLKLRGHLRGADFPKDIQTDPIALSSPVQS